MHAPLLVAFLAGLGGMWGWGISEFATKKSVDRVGAISSLVWAHVFGTVILLAVLLTSLFVIKAPAMFPTEWTEWLGLLFFGSLQTAVYYFAYKGFESGQVAVLSPIFASFAGWVALISVFFRGEVLGPGLASALMLIFGGVFLINVDLAGLREGRVRLKRVPGLKEILIATVLATGWTLGWGQFTIGKDWLVYATFMFIAMTLSAFVLAWVNRVTLLQGTSGAWQFLWLVGIGEALAYLAISLGYATTPYTSVVAILSGASSLPTILLAWIFLKERMAFIQMVGAAVIIVGIVLVSSS